MGACRKEPGSAEKLNEIKKGLSKTAPAAEKMMTKADGSKCTTAEENQLIKRSSQKNKTEKIRRNLKKYFLL